MSQVSRNLRVWAAEEIGGIFAWAVMGTGVIEWVTQCLLDDRTF